MNSNFKYESIPHQFNYYLNDQCKHAEDCIFYHKPSPYNATIGELPSFQSGSDGEIT